MIIDKIENLEQYSSLNPWFAQVVTFIQQTDLMQLPLGRNEIDGDNLYANVMQTSPKSQEEAKMETHRAYIDIQIPLTDSERMGYTPTVDCPEADAPYNETDDYQLYTAPCQSYCEVKPGMMAIFFPQDAHAPAISDKGLRKVVFKVKVSE